MARGRKKQLTINEKIEICTNEIQQLEDALIAKRQELDELMEVVENEKKEKLLKAIEESGKTIDDVLEFLK